MYCLYAVLGKSRDLLERDLLVPSAAIVHLREGIGLIPLSEDVLTDIERRDVLSPAPAVPGFEFLSTNVASWIEALSRGTTLAYAEAEFIAGEGHESALVWRDGTVIEGPMSGTGAINRALQALGVVSASGKPEFELVGLDRHRQPQEWLED